LSSIYEHTIAQQLISSLLFGFKVKTSYKACYSENEEE